jgi:hypothetical protein
VAAAIVFLVAASAWVLLAIDRSQPLWTVKVGSLGGVEPHLPPPQTRTVTTAWLRPFEKYWRARPAALAETAEELE